MQQHEQPGLRSNANAFLTEIINSGIVKSDKSATGVSYITLRLGTLNYCSSPTASL